MKMKKDIICAIAGMAAAAGVKLFGGWTPTLSIVLKIRERCCQFNRHA